VSSISSLEAPEKSGANHLDSTPGGTGERGTDWKALVWLTILVAGGLSLFERLKHFLFPHLISWQTQAVTVGVGTIAAVIGAHYLTRKLERALALHAQAENKLALERNVLRTVTDNIPDSIFAKDADGRYLFVNKAFVDLRGLKSPDELLGKSAFDLFSKERAEASHADDLQVMRSAGAVMERERPTIDARGRQKWLLTTKVPLISSGGSVVGIVGLHRDVTQRVEAEERLRHSEENLAAAQRIAHMGSFELDLISLEDMENNPVRCSDEIFRILGYDPGGVEASRLNLFRVVCPDDRLRFRETLVRTVQEGQPYNLDFTVVRADGTERVVQGRGDLVYDPKTRKPLKLVGSLQDVTDHRLAEAQVREANQNLAKRVRELQQRSKEIGVLSEMGSRLQACRTADEAYVEIGHAAEQLFPEWSGALCVISSSRNVVETVAEWGRSASGDRVFAPDDCWALRRGQPQLFTMGDKRTKCRHTDAAKVAESFCVPLMAQGEALGILNLQLARVPGEQGVVARSSGEEDRRLATVLAEQVGLALGNLRLRETLRNQSIRDALTGLFNRRYLEESLEREFSRASRNKSSVAVIMMDLDHFKRFNDTFGHQAGDALLRSLGDFLRRSTRGQDIACRYGGEEFALVLSDSSLAGASQRAEIMRQEVKHLNVQYAGQLLGAVSVSIGLAVFPDHGSTISEVLHAADQALYGAKREGRDRVSVWTTESVV
jgi:diguanylate cyclase (GGDEF)-like protein/PAS domain S-box-containing protein